MRKNRKIIILLSIFFIMLFSFNVLAASNKQAPELKEMVEKGEIEPLSERIPDEPLVIEPIEATGKYGGTWDRLTNWEEFGHFRMALYGHSLVRFIDDGTDVAPNLLVDWEKNEDKTEWILHFRKGIKWSDGEPFTADDFMFWWEDMVLDSEFVEVVPDEFKSGGKTADITKIDDYTIKVEYAAPAPMLMERLAMWPNRGIGARMITPKHYMKQFHPEYSDDYDNYEELEERLDWWFYPEAPTLTAWKPAKYEAGNYLIWERNPYFWAVDDEGKQLPYIDKVDIRYLSDNEVLKLKLSNGESDMQMRAGILSVEDMSLIKRKEEESNIKLLQWDSNAGAEPVFVINHNHPDPDKRELYRNPEFKRAISHAIDREKILKMVYFDLAEPTTGTLVSNAVEYETERGRELYEKWKNLAVEYKPEKVKETLDELGVVDQNGDGWREMPNGEELTLRIDADASASKSYLMSNELVKENWEDVGLKTIINTMDGSELGNMVHSAEFDIRDSWGVGEGPNYLWYPQWIVPIHQDRWAPLYGNWYRIQGTDREGIDADKPPRERSPAWKEPEEGGPVNQLHELYDKAKVAVTQEERNEYVYEIINIHLEHGLFFIGIGENPPLIGVVKDYMRNVPDVEDLKYGGFGGWIMAYPAIVNPPAFWMDK